MKYLPLLLVALAFTGCTGRQAESDIARSAQVIFNAAASLPDSPQRRAIQANAFAIGHAVGHDLELGQ